ncbi:MAG: DUF4181 domain-containing protein [Eubacteriales bacterium]|nr:DUF4181 domain-containing protein [Eubacteriales bacterium]
MEFIILGVFLIIVGIFLEKYLIKKYGIEKNKGWTRYVNKHHMWGEYILLAIGIILFAAFAERGTVRSNGILILVIVVHLFRITMQWRYEREKREHILTALSIAMFSVLLVGANIFLP